MMPILSPAEASALDRAARDRGVPADRLMENAGREVANAAVRLAGGRYGRRAVIVCGRGNNGGDGFVAARHLASWGLGVAVLLLDPDAVPPEPAAANLERLRATRVRVRRWSDPAALRELVRADVAIDAIVGTGFRGAPEGSFAEAIAALERAGLPVVAVDVPSGVNGATGQVAGAAVRADLTVAFGAAKAGVVLHPGAAYAGVVEVADIGFPTDLVRGDLWLVEGRDVAAWLPVRDPETHKRAAGYALVIGGSRAMTGAVGLMAESAYRVGAGLVAAAVPTSVLPVIQAAVREAVFAPLPETDAGTISGGSDRLAEILEQADALAIGPGMTRDERTAAWIRELVRTSEVPVVLDADGLGAFAGRAAELADRKGDLVLTPHAGEFGRLAELPRLRGRGRPGRARARACCHDPGGRALEGVADARRHARRLGPGEPDRGSVPGDGRDRRRPHGDDRGPARARGRARRRGVRGRVRPRGRGVPRRRGGRRGHDRGRRARPRRRSARGGDRAVIRFRPTVVEVDLDAIRHNVRILLPDRAELLAVVKADGYGHGDATVARAALEAGATRIGVALVEEGLGLRERGVQAPILVLSEFPRGSEKDALAAGLTPSVYTGDGIGGLAEAAGSLGRPVGVHLKVDTGMHRVGVWPPSAATAYARAILDAGLELEGLWTHFAASEEDEDGTHGQLRKLLEARDLLARDGIHPRRVHAANSAATIRFPETHLDLVRPGAAIYGLDPGGGIGPAAGLRPALTWRSAVALVKRLSAGERLSYGWRYALERDANVATVPVGYGDGYPRALSSRAEVLIRGRRHPVAGAVTMDQILVDCGDDEVLVGDDVVLLGAQGDERITAEELGAHVGTIGYEMVTAISERVPREVLG